MLNLTQSLRQSIQIAPDSPATLFRDRSYTWAEVTERIACFAAALNELGVCRDDRVAVLALNSDRYFEAYYAVWWAGAAIVPLNTRWTVKENIYALNDAEPAILLVDGFFTAQLAPILDAVAAIRSVVYIGEGVTPDGLIDYESLVDAHAPGTDAMRHGDALAGIFYTGGTTGFPKGVMLSHAGLYMSSLGGLAGGSDRIDDYVYLHNAPMFHLADVTMVTLGTMVQCTHAFIEQFEPVACLAAIERFRVRHAVFVPAMLGMFLQHPDFDKYDLSSLTRISYGASPMPVALLKETMRRLPGIDLVQAYGQTELSPLATMLPGKDHVLEGPGSERLKSAGRTLPHCEIDIVDENLAPVPSGDVGQIRVRGANAMLGYWKLPDVTAETIVDGWVLTGDAGYIDADGYLFLVDRVKDMIVSGGENVYSVEVENAIMEHRGVAQCAVIGIPHDLWVEQVHAIVVPKPGGDLTEDGIIEHCHGYIAGYKCPRSVEIRAEALPLSGAGKVLKRELRQAYVGKPE